MAFGEVRMALEILGDEISQKCLQDFQNNTKVSELLESKLIVHLGKFSETLNSLQTSIYSVEKRVEHFEMTNVAQAKDNECLRADAQTLSTTIRILLGKGFHF